MFRKRAEEEAAIRERAKLQRELEAKRKQELFMQQEEKYLEHE